MSTAIKAVGWAVVAKIGVQIVAKWGDTPAVISFEAESEWLALRPEDNDKVKGFKIGAVHSITVTHENGVFTWPAFLSTSEGR